MARQPRVRDYRAEEAKRNAESRARGFKNRYEERLARAGGILPPARDLRRDDDVGRAARKRDAEVVNARRAGFDSYREYRTARGRAREWSDAHSRQPVSQYSPRMNPEEFQDYYAALVKPWGQQRSPDDKEALKRFIVNRKHHLTEREYDESPRY